MQQTKEKASCTAATVQNASVNEPTKAQDNITARDPKSQILRDPAIFKMAYLNQFTASGAIITDSDIETAEVIAQFVHRAYRCGFADGQKGGDLHD